MRYKKANINWDSLGFDVVETKSMFTANCSKEGHWSEGSLIPYGNIEISPAAVVLNYGQGVFEGTKAFHTSKDNIVLFRPDRNANRMSWSTQRLCIPTIDPNFFMHAVVQTVKDNIEFVPPYGKGSLYVRPIVWGTSPALGVAPALEYTFMVFGLLWPYFRGGTKMLNLKIETNYHVLLRRVLVMQKQ